MTLTTYNELEQGSDQWLAARCGIVTASVVGKLITDKTIKPASNPESRALTAQLAIERFSRWTEPSYVNFDMQRGLDDEPRARDKYAEHYAPVTEVGFMTENKWGFTIGYSPDGLVGDDGLIEIKSRRQKTQLTTVLADCPPAENMAQLQCGLLVTGRKWIDYVSYCGGLPLYVKRVYPQQKWFDTIIDAVRQFEANATEMLRVYTEAIEGAPTTERVLEMEMTF